ncbi:MAG: hypothetical protein ABI175_16965, partial [Polyangiales bacterium]
MAMAAQRRRKGRLVVLGVVSACAFVGLVGLVVSIAGKKSTPDERSEQVSATGEKPASTKAAATSGSTAVGKPSASSSIVAAVGTTPHASSSSAVPKGFGRLTVDAKTKAQVFIGDRSYGDVGELVIVPCGYRWVLVGKADAKGHLAQRLSKSQSVFVKCGAANDTYVTIALK